jgi:hypothetical protein
MAAEMYKNALLERSGDATTLADAFSGRYARALRNAFTDWYAKAGAPVLPFFYQAAVAQANPDYYPMWAGQEVQVTAVGGVDTSDGCRVFRQRKHVTGEMAVCRFGGSETSEQGLQQSLCRKRIEAERGIAGGEPRRADTRSEDSAVGNGYAGVLVGRKATRRERLRKFNRVRGLLEQSGVARGRQIGIGVEREDSTTSGQRRRVPPTTFDSFHNREAPLCARRVIMLLIWSV